MNPVADKTVRILTMLLLCHFCLISDTNALYNGVMKYIIIIVIIIIIIIIIIFVQGRPIPVLCIPRRASAAAHLLGLRVRIPPRDI
jgi:hypothetical protein